MFTRDSVIWGLAILGALLTYLVQVGTPPTEWPYSEWVKALAFLVATLAGKLATSPLPSKEERAWDRFDSQRFD